MNYFNLSISRTMNSGLILRFRNNNLKRRSNVHVRSLRSSVTSNTTRRLAIKIKRTNFSLRHPNNNVSRTASDLCTSLPSMRHTIVRLRTSFQRLKGRLICKAMLYPRLARLIFKSKRVNMRFHVIKGCHRKLHRTKASGYTSTREGHTCRSITKAFCLNVKRVITNVHFLDLYLFRFNGYCHRPITNGERFMVKCSFLVGRNLLTLRLSPYHFRFYLYYTSIYLYNTRNYLVKRLISSNGRLSHLGLLPFFRARTNSATQRLKCCIRVLPPASKNKVAFLGFGYPKEGRRSKRYLSRFLFPLFLFTNYRWYDRRTYCHSTNCPYSSVRRLFLLFFRSLFGATWVRISSCHNIPSK